MKHKGGRENIGRLIGFIHRHAKMFFNREFSTSRLGSGSFLFLMMLHHQEGLTQQELSQHLHLDKANTARAIQKLINQGYVRKERDQYDQRAYRIYATQAGAALVPEIKKVLKSWSDILTQGFDKEEKNEALRLLSRMAENAITHVRPPSQSK